MNQIAIFPRLIPGKGYILVDVLVGIVVISVALIPISAIFIHAMQVDTLAKDYTVAANLAQKQLELLKTRPFAYWSDLALPCTIDWQDTLLPPVAPYQVITTGTTSAHQQLIQVTVTVSWQEHGKDYNLQFVTCYPKL